jgi:hypothetical protein
MTSSKIADVLELALIELEYAVADFLHQSSSGDPEARRHDLDTLMSKLLGANRTVQNAIAALDAAKPAAAATTRQHRRSRRGSVAA